MVCVESEVEPPRNAREFINYELELYLSNPCIHVEEEITSMLDEKDDATDNKPVEEVDNVQVGDVVVDGIGFKDVESALVTLKQFME